MKQAFLVSLRAPIRLLFLFQASLDPKNNQFFSLGNGNCNALGAD